MYLDLIIIIPVVWGMVRGFKRGLIIELCTLMALILGVFGAAEFGEMASEFLQNEFNTDPRISLVLAFTVLFILIVVAVTFFGKVLSKVVKMVALGMINKLFGLLFGGAKFLLIVSALIFVFEGFPVTSNLIPVDWKSDSMLYQPVSNVTLKLYPVLDDQTWIDDIKSQIENVKDEVGLD